MISFDPINIPLKGTHLIEAAAGTGKTYTITSLFLRLVLAGYGVDRILVVTFTEAATAELKDRIRIRLREALSTFNKGETDDGFLHHLLLGSNIDKPLLRNRLQGAISGFDEAAVFTIHGFCNRMLHENAFESGMIFDPELVVNPQPLYREIVSDFWALEVYTAPEWVIRLLARKKRSPDTLLPLVSRVISQPNRIIIPQWTPPGHGDAQEIYRQAKGLWENDHREIETLLQTHPGVNRRSYNKNNLVKWLSNVAIYFEPSEWLGSSGDDSIGKLTQTRLNRMNFRAEKDHLPPRHSFFEACDDLFSFPDRWEIGFLRKLFDYAGKELVCRKEERGIHFFDDLIHHLDDALTRGSGEILAQKISDRYRAVLMDEFQDTNHTQYRILNRIYQGSGAPFFLVGDPKQSIYTFRGADIFAYLKAVVDVGEPAHTLDVNWRSDPLLIKGINTLFKRNRNPFINVNIKFSPVKPWEGSQDVFRINGRQPPPLRFIFFNRHEDQDHYQGVIKKGWFKRQLPEIIARDISKLLMNNAVIQGRRQERLSPGDIAVLVRTNQQAREMQAALQQLSIPGVVTSGQSVFESKEALELWRILQAVAEPTDDTLIRTALSTKLFGFSGNDLWQLQADDEPWEGWIRRFRNWHERWRAGGFITMMQEIFDLRPDEGSAALITRLLKRADGQRRVTNFQHLSELLHAAAESEHLGINGLQRWFMGQRTGGEVADNHELRLETDANAVQLVTIHKSKGLEYPVVYVPYLWDGGLSFSRDIPVAFHDPDHDNAPMLDLGSQEIDTNRILARQETMAENMRLLYVAVTRARHLCTVVWAPVNQFENSPLGYILHHPGGDLSPETMAKRIGKLTDEQILADLNRLSKDAEGAIGIETFQEKKSVLFEPETSRDGQPARRIPTRRLKRQWRWGSFSGLAAETDAVVSAQEMGQDWDDISPPQELLTYAAVNEPAPARNRVALAEFAKGPTAGHFFHAVYENLNFQYASRFELEYVVVSQLAGFGFDPIKWKEPVCDAVSRSLECDLDSDVPGLQLRMIPTSTRLNELPFVFPVARTHTAVPNIRVTTHRLATLFDCYATRTIAADYGEHIARLDFAPFTGFMKGVIDLIFQYQGKWYLVDYKSNFLGDRYDDYVQSAMARTMAAHHYYLQYHIYTVALHRYLAYRLKDYDYDTHFGKVYYLFIRGMSPTAVNGGIFIDRPPKALVENISALFSGFPNSAPTKLSE